MRYESQFLNKGFLYNLNVLHQSRAIGICAGLDAVVSLGALARNAPGDYKNNVISRILNPPL
jgi:hypothetical protein